MDLVIITPEKTVLKDSVDEVIVPTTTGEITVLPNHTELLSRIKEGELIIKKGAKSTSFAVTGGFIEILKQGITILADYAVRAEDIQVAKAQLAKDRAEKAMKERGDKREFAVAEADMRRAIVELQIARKYKRSSPS